jgi:hypothetical protein
MNTNASTKAPDIPNPAYPRGGYPTGGAKLGPAWRDIWNRLSRAQTREDKFLDGRELADTVAIKHDLAPATLVALLSRAAKAGVLDKELRPVTSTRGLRNRTFYRIPADG